MTDIRRDEIAGKDRVDKHLERESMLNKTNHFASSSHSSVLTNDEQSIKALECQSDNQIPSKELRVIFQLIDQNRVNRMSSLKISKLFDVVPEEIFLTK